MVFLRVVGIVLDLPRRDLGDHDGRSDRIASALRSAGALGMVKHRSDAFAARSLRVAAKAV